MTRLKHSLRLQYGSALAAESRQAGNIPVYGSNGQIGTHDQSNMLSPAIVVGRKGSHGKVVWAEHGGFCIDTALFVDRRFTSLCLRYAFYLLQTLGLDKPSKDSAVPGLDRIDAYNKEIPSVPLATQRAIADFLDRETLHIEQLIEMKERMAEAIDQRVTSLTWTLVTGRACSDSPTVDSGFEWIGPIPASWRAVRIKTVARLESGHTPSRSKDEYWSNPTVPWVSLADSAQLRRVDVITETKYMISEAGLAGSSARILPAGTVSFTRDATVGLAAILGQDMAVSQHLVGWVCGPELDPYYLLHVIYAMQHELNRLTWGATIKTIGMPDLRKLSCPLPALNEQKRIVRELQCALDSSKRLTTKLTRSISLLRAYRSALITAAVTGQIDVATWSTRGNTDHRLEAIEHDLEAEREEATV